MLLIIIFHCSQGCFTGLAGELLGRPWSVAAFFIIGGFFLKTDALGQPLSFLKGKFKRLYLPATIIYALFVLLHNVFVMIGWYPLGGCHPYTGAPFELYGWKETGIGLAKVLAAGGSGELAMGAMWFIYTLLYVFVGMTILYWLVRLVCKKNESNSFYWMTVCCLLLAAISCVLSQRYGITVSRFSVALTALFLVWWGMIINRMFQWSFDKWWGVAIALIVIVQYVLLQKEGMAMARNEFQDILQLTLGSTAAIYVWMFIAKKIRNTMVGRFFALMGRESLYLMAFHIVGFFVCNSVLVGLGVFDANAEKGLYTFKMGDNFFVLLVYVVFAIATSFALLYGYRGLKMLILRNKAD